jgi:AraC-like DNA-binding protein
MTISEVAYAVGFGDPLYFSRMFSRQFGLSPSGARG